MLSHAHYYTADALKAWFPNTTPSVLANEKIYNFLLSDTAPVACLQIPAKDQLHEIVYLSTKPRDTTSLQLMVGQVGLINTLNTIPSVVEKTILPANKVRLLDEATDHLLGHIHTERLSHYVEYLGWDYNKFMTPSDFVKAMNSQSDYQEQHNLNARDSLMAIWALSQGSRSERLRIESRTYTNFLSLIEDRDLLGDLYDAALDAKNKLLSAEEKVAADLKFWKLLRKAMSEGHITEDMPRTLVDTTGRDRNRITTGVIPTPLACFSDRNEILKPVMRPEARLEIHSAVDLTTGGGGLLFISSTSAEDDADQVLDVAFQFLPEGQVFMPNYDGVIFTSGQLGPAQIVPIGELEAAVEEMANSFDVRVEFLGLGGTFDGISHEKPRGSGERLWPKILGRGKIELSPR